MLSTTNKNLPRVRATSRSEYDVIVIGGGAAGLMCAATAGRRGRRVLILEGANKVGKKILMSGGGRCNFTNLSVGPENFICANPSFCISALRRYSQWDFIAAVEHYGIDYHEREHGQLFCDHSSKDILKLLLSECASSEVEIQTDCLIESVSNKPNERFAYHVRTSEGDFSTGSLVVACGALSIPKMGASGFGYAIAEQFNLGLRPTRAGLVPLTFSGELKNLCERLSGVSVPCSVACVEIDPQTAELGRSFTEALMFSHRGMTGPVVLQISNYWREGQPIAIDLLPHVDFRALLLERKSARPKSLLRTIISESLPRNLVSELEELLWKDTKHLQIGEWPDQTLQVLATKLHAWELRPAGTEGYRTAEVTLGGVDTDELSSKTMEAKRQPGLYFIGEVVDVTGHLGGFNFQWAWSSGFAAGSYA